MYRIESQYRGVWTTETIGDDDANQFDTIAEAEAAIERLKTYGEDWQNAEYRVVEIEP